MRPGDRVLIYSASGTFRAAPGVVTEVVIGAAWVQVEGEPAPMAFGRREIVPLEESSPALVAGE